MTTSTMAFPEAVSRDKWLAARKGLLNKEKELRKQLDALAAERRRLPMVAITEGYSFERPDGSRATLCDLFEGRRQLIVYHFMFDPNDPPPGKSGDPWEEGCPGCSFVADNVPNHLEHLHARGTTFALVSRAPQAKIRPFHERMGWNLPWYSSFGSEFNYDFNVTTDEQAAPVEYNYKDRDTLEREGLTYHLAGEQPGLSCFVRDDERVFHTYSTYARGLEPMLGTYHLLDLTAFGRQENWEDSPEGWPQTAASGPGDWVRHHDKYGDEIKGSSSCCHT